MFNARSIGWCIAAGLMGGVSIAWPINVALEFGQAVWWLQLASLVLYAKVLQVSSTPRTAAIIGFVYNLALLVGSVHWLHIAMDTYGGLPGVLAWSAVVVLCSALSVYGAAMAWVYASVVMRQPRFGVIVFAATWVLAELARGQWLTGFAWGASSYAHVDGPIAALAPWIGAYGIAGVVAALAATLAQVGTHAWGKTWFPAAGLGALLLAANVSPDFTASAGEIDTVLLQGNIAQDEKFDSRTGVAQSLAWYAAELEGANTPLVLAPETAIPVLPHQLPEGYLEKIAVQAVAQRSVKLVGIPLVGTDRGYTNSVIALGGVDTNPIYRYDKHHLVPFGEFIPPLFKWFVRMMDIPLGDFGRGGLEQAPLVVGQQKIAPSICYEDLFSEELALRFKDTNSRPTIFANFSNLAWFGQSVAMHQHLHISRLRSREFGRPFLRVSNNGITSIVDHQGRVAAQIAPFSQGVLHAAVQGRTGLTPYAWWSSRWGQLPMWFTAIGVLLWSWTRREVASQ